MDILSTFHDILFSVMELEQMLERYKKITAYFDAKYPDHAHEFRVLARLGKIMEELGELSSAVHSEMGMQRQEKLDLHKREDLESEWADLFNTVMLFGMVMGIDMPKTIEKRLDEIYKRYNLTD